jgi:hypothetical protein
MLSILSDSTETTNIGSLVCRRMHKMDHERRYLAVDFGVYEVSTIEYWNFMNFQRRMETSSNGAHVCCRMHNPVDWTIERQTDTMYEVSVVCISVGSFHFPSRGLTIVGLSI